MTSVPDDAERSRQRALVRDGYDAISAEYRSDDGAAAPDSSESTAQYGAWVDELAALVRPGGHILDLGCGAGVPTSRLLVAAGFAVTGLDISPVQIARARARVPTATFIVADMATWDCETERFDAVASLYALIHVPLED